MLEDLKEIVYQQNLELPKRGLIKYTWGNVSQVDREKGLFVIKPSGVDYDAMKASDMVVCDFDGNVVEGDFRPSSDMPTHAKIYKYFQDVGGVVHTHSPWAVVWSQAGKDLPALGTTHADTFYGTVPCARFLTQEELDKGYEAETGAVIVETFKERGLKPNEVPGILLQGHGPFTWGKDAEDAVMHAVVLEEVSKMNFFTRQLNPDSPDLPQHILDKHYQRKHGKNAYYGQK
ncbi:L-ribulose-5-phosphate 4-epimerase [Streptococcus thoraltensis]|uniref:L-ribulose-5-phosphate 4-epimerase n=1 Tax=Streptococcus thoraltensis TaxID=55085 RepID=UPI0003678592|nr:L-ribulose-5-phosphate 4-epimerase [Streptococcus thoraltensis]MDY4761640.1 L-ribulose-5-phosphate 4-epimerase [Streptococcus thoraltensis]